MKVVITEMLEFPAEIIFAVLTDIPHHTDWLEEPVESVQLIDGPARLGTKWEQNSQLFGKNLVAVNTCNLYETNRLFGWMAEKPFLAQFVFLLEPIDGHTNLTWKVESVASGIIKLAEPLLVKQTDAMMRKSLAQLKIFIKKHSWLSGLMKS